MTNFRLFVADALDLMGMQPDESIDLIVTDTAYESLEKHRAVGTTTRLKKSAASSNEWFPIFRNDRFEEFFHEAFRVLKKNTHLYFYCDEETADVAKPIGRAAGFTFWKSLVWAKTRQNMKPDADDLVVEHQAMGMGYHYRSAKEFVLFFEKGKRKLTDLGVRDVLPFPAIKNGYPTEKPVDLNKVLIRLSSEPGEIVLDPFMGSASTGVAAVKLGRVFMGGDIKETAVTEAQKRLKAAGGDNQYDPIVIPVSERGVYVAPEPPPKKTRAKKQGAKPEEKEPVSSRQSAEIVTGPEDPPPFAHISGYLDEKTMEGDGPTSQKPKSDYMPIAGAHTQTEGYLAAIAEPKLDGMFMTGPLPGGPTRHLSPPNLIPPPRPATCQHGDVRSACILCRARR